MVAHTFPSPHPGEAFASLRLAIMTSDSWPSATTSISCVLVVELHMKRATCRRSCVVAAGVIVACPSLSTGPLVIPLFGGVASRLGDPRTSHWTSARSPLQMCRGTTENDLICALHAGDSDIGIAIEKREARRLTFCFI